MKQSFWFFGAQVTILADHSTTAGRYDLIEGEFAPGASTPLHVHRAYAEEIYVLQGQLTVHLKGAGPQVLRAGERATVPLGVPHRVANEREAPARALTVASPSGFARFIQLVGVAAQAGDTKPAALPSPIVAARAMAEVGDELLGMPGVVLAVARWWDKLTTGRVATRAK